MKEFPLEDAKLRQSPVREHRKGRIFCFQRWIIKIKDVNKYYFYLIYSLPCMQYYFSVNLDSVYDGPFAPVYQLARRKWRRETLFSCWLSCRFTTELKKKRSSFTASHSWWEANPEGKDNNLVGVNSEHIITSRHFNGVWKPPPFAKTQMTGVAYCFIYLLYYPA